MVWAIIGAHDTVLIAAAVATRHSHPTTRINVMVQQRQELRKAGLKVTLPRLKILEILESADERHLSAEDIYRELLDSGEDIGLATVYRVLTQFEAADLIIRHNFEGGHSVFELDNGDHHDHMVCIESGVDHNLVLYVRPIKDRGES